MKLPFPFEFNHLLNFPLLRLAIEKRKQRGSLSRFSPACIISQLEKPQMDVVYALGYLLSVDSSRPERAALNQINATTPSPLCFSSCSPMLAEANT